MKQRYKVFLSLIYFSLLVILDQVSKYFAIAGKINFSSDLFSVEAQRNYGLALGYGAHLGQIFNILVGFTFSILFILTFWIIFYFLKKYELSFLKFSLINLISGIGGNAFDRISRGYVIDFLNIKFLFLQNIFINVADIFLIAGILGVTFEIFRKSTKIWYEANQRKVFLVDPEFQKFEAFLFISMIWASSFVFYVGFLGIIFYFNVSRKDMIVWITLITQLILTTILSIIAYYFAIFHSNKTSGVLLSFKKFLNETLSDSNSPTEWKSRDSDFHQDILKKCADNLSDFIKKNKK